MLHAETLPLILDFFKWVVRRQILENNAVLCIRKMSELYLCCESCRDTWLHEQVNTVWY